jgi:hypothetical protein
VLTAQAAKAKLREQYVPPVKPAGRAVDARPKEVVSYKSVSFAVVENQLTFNILASTAGINFFGEATALGLGDYLPTAPRAPRYFQPAKVHAVKGVNAPKYETPAYGGAPYAKYTAEASGTAQASFTAPVSANTPALLIAKVGTIFAAKKGSVGGVYGRLWFTPERALIAENGNPG